MELPSSTTVVLPGDLVNSFSESDKQFVSEIDGFYATKVIGRVSDGKFEVCKSAIVPKVHDVVIARVIRAKRKEAHLLILTTNGKSLGNPLLAELRSVDIRERDVDSVVASEFCKPGELVRARVVALGRSGFYAQLSTAEEGMGVVRLDKC